jgi:putative spermidine/putrescine transport system permease protein
MSSRSEVVVAAPADLAPAGAAAPPSRGRGPVAAAAFGLPAPVRVGLLLSPALLIVGVLFLGGFVFGILQSLGYLSLIGDGRFSLDAYRAMVDDPAVRASVALTLRVSLLSTAISAVLAVAAALLIRSTRRGRRFLTVVFQLNLPVPHIVSAAAMLLLLQQSGFLSRLSHAAGLTGTPAGFPPLTADGFGVAIIASYVWKEVPFIGVVVLAALQAGVADYEEVARTLGAGPWARFRTVVLPIITPAVLSTSIIVFSFTFGSYEVPYLLGRPYPATLPVVAYQNYTDTDLAARPVSMAIAVFIAVFVGLLVLLYMKLSDRYLRRMS